MFYIFLFTLSLEGRKKARVRVNIRGTGGRFFLSLAPLAAGYSLLHSNHPRIKYGASSERVEGYHLLLFTQQKGREEL
jgi:hypothetical protein